MKLLLDENADIRLTAHLRELGPDVAAIARDYPHQLRDLDVLAIARSEQRILITNDLDFGELIVRQRLPHFGVILLRLDNDVVRPPAYATRTSAARASGYPAAPVARTARR